MTLREVFLAAIKSLSRGKTSFIQALLAFCPWTSPMTLKSTESPSIPNSTLDASMPQRSPSDFLDEAGELFSQSIQGDALKDLSFNLKAQFTEGLLQSPACMLPSYSHQLPNRSEHGHYLALDVGGSTLRIALVELRGGSRGAEGRESRILRLQSFSIEREIKNLEGMAFFDWMARNIVDTAPKALVDSDKALDRPLLMGLAWSFPIE